MQPFTEYFHHVVNVPEAEMDVYFRILERESHFASEPAWIGVLDIGAARVQIECHEESFVQPVRTLFGFCLRDGAGGHDHVLRLCRGDVSGYVSAFAKGARSISISSRNGRKIFLHVEENRLDAFDAPTGRMYSCASEFSREHLARAGHLFVHLLGQCVDSPDSALVHAAAVGLGGRGLLICGKGGKGKSSLAVSCLLAGFSYVADDYLVLRRDGDELLAHPAYSIITLTSEMQERMPGLKAAYLHDNYDGGKRVLDISAHHDRFVKEMPIRAILHPNIADRAEPSIEPGGGGAVVQLTNSTTAQMGNANDRSQTLKILGLVGSLPLYRIDLARDLRKNVLLLRNFLEKGLDPCTD